MSASSRSVQPSKKSTPWSASAFCSSVSAMRGTVRGRGGAVPELPTGTVTFLFTDLEGSTRLWEAHPDAMKPALARHDEILREAVEAHDGHVVKTTGDGVHAAFA